MLFCVCVCVNMQGVTSQKLHSKRKIIQFLFLYINCKTVDIKFQNNLAKDNNRKPKTFTLHMTELSVHLVLTPSVSNTVRVVGKVRGLTKHYSHFIQEHLCPLEENGISGALDIHTKHSLVQN